MLGFSILTPEYAASKVVDAIEKNQTVLIMPRGAYFSAALQQYVQQLCSFVLVQFYNVFLVEILFSFVCGYGNG